jgi:hypothetical protein
MEKKRESAVARAILASFLLLAAAAGFAAPSIGERLAAIRALGPRSEGSKGEAAAFDYVEASLRESGLAPTESDFSDASEDYSRSRIVEAAIKGSRGDELSIVVPVGTWTDSPDPTEGAYGVALALDEAARLAEAKSAGEPCPITVRFVFLGAEKRGAFAAGAVAGLGSKTWIARQEGRAGLAVLYLNMPAAPSRVSLRSAGRKALSPFWYYDGARLALEASGAVHDIEANRQQAYRLGLATDYGPAAPYLEAAIPAVELRGDEPAGPRGPGAAPSGDGWFAAFVGRFAQAEGGGFPESWDRHYFVVELGRRIAVLTETTYVAALVALVALVLSSFLVASVARRKAVSQMLKRVPAMSAQVLAMFGVLALVFLAGKGLSMLESAAFGSSDAWRLMPRLFAAARILFSFLLFLCVLTFLVEKRRLTPNPYFYEFAALACLAIDVLVFSVADLSASFYFIWALVLVEVSLALRRRWATLLAYLFMYLPLLVVAGELALRPDLSAYGKLVAPGFLDVFSLTALSLPFFVFTASPLLFFARPGTAARRKAVVFFAVSAVVIEALALCCFWAAAPRDGPGRRDLSITELVDQDKGRFDIRLRGLRSLGAGSLARGGTRLDYSSAGDRVELAGKDDKRRIRIIEETSPFLDRVDENLRIDFSDRPYSLDMTLESAEDILLYDCSLPYKVAVDGKSAVLYAGVDPGAEFSFSVTVPAGFRSRLIVRARYLRPLEDCSQSSGSPLGYAGVQVQASREIGEARG